MLVIGITFLLYQLIYPLRYRDEISFYAKEFNLPEPIICAIINVESGFEKDALSNKGACGLMQLMPDTAQSIAYALDENFEKDNLFQPETNIKYGSYYISSLLKNFELEEALCAYNAGPTKVRGWLKNPEYSSDGVKLSVIPYEETRLYVERVKKNINFYQNKF